VNSGSNDAARMGEMRGGDLVRRRQDSRQMWTTRGACGTHLRAYVIRAEQWVGSQAAVCACYARLPIRRWYTSCS
jgi:hypothetical protein